MFLPFKIVYQAERLKHKKEPGRSTIPKEKLAPLVKKAYDKTMTPVHIKNACGKVGAYPATRADTESDLLKADLTHGHKANTYAKLVDEFQNVLRKKLIESGFDPKPFCISEKKGKKEVCAN